MTETVVSYRVQVTRTVKRDGVIREYQRIADTGNEKDGGAIYGYIDKPQSVADVTELLDIAVDALNLRAVVDAVLPPP